MGDLETSETGAGLGDRRTGLTFLRRTAQDAHARMTGGAKGVARQRRLTPVGELFLRTFFCSRGCPAHGRPRFLIGIYRIAALLSKEDGSCLDNPTSRDTPRAGGQAKSASSSPSSEARYSPISCIGGGGGATSAAEMPMSGRGFSAGIYASCDASRFRLTLHRVAEAIALHVQQGSA